MKKDKEYYHTKAEYFERKAKSYAILFLICWVGALTFAGIAFYLSVTNIPEYKIEYYEKSVVSFCEMMSDQTQVVILLSNETTIKELNRFVLDGILPCEQWVLE